MKSFARHLRLAALAAVAIGLSGCCLLWPYDHDHGHGGRHGEYRGRH